MARQSRQSPFEDWVDIASKLPWWVNLILAVLAYSICHHYAGIKETIPSDGKGMGVYVGHMFWRTLAHFGQYLLSAVFVLGALISAFKTWRVRKRFQETAALGTQASLLSMTWQQFEALVGEYFRRKGFHVSEIGGGGPDGGVDLELRRGSERYFVQCKQWRATRVGVDVVRELYGVMAAKGASGAYVVSSGRFTPDAQEFVDGRNISLIDGQRLVKEMQNFEVKATGVKVTAPMSHPSPTCPTCGALMVSRTAKKGPNAGCAFWGCSTYPRCRKTLPLAN